MKTKISMAFKKRVSLKVKELKNSMVNFSNDSKFHMFDGYKIPRIDRLCQTIAKEFVFSKMKGKLEDIGEEDLVNLITLSLVEHYFDNVQEGDELL